ncbi:MAG: AAA family ATPase [Rickettsiales bacterium]|nr:AAA family ATPase [Rickettsiales bacterium]
MRILMTWLGHNDLIVPEGDPKARPPGPTASVLDSRDFDAVVVLSNYPPKREKTYKAFLDERNAPPVHLRHVRLRDPTDYAGIHHAVVDAMAYIEDEFGPDVDLSVHVSPGTPQMHAIWALLTKTRFSAELIQSSKEAGVQTVSIPFDISAEFIPMVEKAGRKLERAFAFEAPASPALGDIVGESPPMKTAKLRARVAASFNYPVLIQGESGTGKELFARAIHSESRRAKEAFVAVNCGALPEHLAESLLFGHEKGAFTGADKAKSGFFEQAQSGTLFLDEIGELPLNLQVIILRALQEGVIRRVGGDQDISVDVRIVAATNRDLVREVREGNFRKDLFHRLAVLILRLPPIREREGDLGALIDHLLKQINTELTGQPHFLGPKELAPGARNLLIRQRWPGNVRELHNALMRAATWTTDLMIRREDVQTELHDLESVSEDSILGRPFTDEFDIREVLGEVVGHYFDRALQESGGIKKTASNLTGFRNYQTFTSWLHKYDHWITYEK